MTDCLSRSYWEVQSTDRRPKTNMQKIQEILEVVPYPRAAGLAFS